MICANSVTAEFVLCFLKGVYCSGYLGVGVNYFLGSGSIVPLSARPLPPIVSCCQLFSRIRFNCFPRRTDFHPIFHILCAWTGSRGHLRLWNQLLPCYGCFNINQCSYDRWQKILYPLVGHTIKLIKTAVKNICRRKTSKISLMYFQHRLVGNHLVRCVCICIFNHL